MKINIPLDSVKKQIREEFRIAPLVTPEMREAEDLWMQIWMGTPPWANDQDRTINFAKAVTGEAARLATMGVSVELSGSTRADWLQERLNEELIPFLRDMVDVGCAAGMFLLKPTPDSIGLYTPPEFTMLSQILKIIAKGQQFQLHYFSAYYGAWCQAWFYVGKGQLNIGRLNEGRELFTSLDFNMVSVNPLT